MKLLTPICLAILGMFIPFSSLLAQFSLVSTDPQRNGLNVAINKIIVLQFNNNVEIASTTNSIYVEGNIRGRISVNVTVSGPKVTIAANDPFYYAEEVTVHLTAGLKSSAMVPLNNPSAFRFTIMNKASEAVPPKFVDRNIFSYPWGEIKSMAPADMDGDGDVDICFIGPMLGWLENNGAGQFSKHDVIEIPHFPANVLPFDIDRDSDVDLLTTAHGGISVFTNDGNQNFTVTATVNGTSIGELDIADFDANGLTDIIYSSVELINEKYDGGTYILYNQGAGSFNKTKINSSHNGKSKCADLDNDGDWDVVQHDGNVLRYLINIGTSFVTDTLFIQDYVRIEDFYFTNLNGDEYMDIVTSTYASASYHASVTGWLNKGALQFTAKELSSDNVYYSSTADFDGDGDGDVIFVDKYYRYAALQNDSDANFTSVVVSNPLTAVHSWSAAITADFDGDGDLDFASTPSNTAIKLYENKLLPFETLTSGIVATTLGDADWGDYDNDGDLDALTTGLVNDNTPATKLYENQNGNFVEVTASLPGLYLSSCDWGDVDNDGDLDILLTGAVAINPEMRNPKSLIYINNSGTFSLLPASESLPQVYYGEARFADFNNDGWLDIVYNGTGYSGVCQSDGKGNFTRRYDFQFGTQYGNADVGDFDKDGDLDIAVSGWVGGDTEDNGALLRVYRNDGNWNFRNLEGDFLGRVGGNVSWTDMDNDGDLDLLVSGEQRLPGGGGVPMSNLYENRSGIFEVIENNEFLYYTDSDGTTATGDFNNDGIADVIASTQGASSYDPALTLFKGDGHGQLVHENVYLPKIATRNINWADFDEDDDLDLFVGSTLIRNNIKIKNTAPTPPSALVVDSVYNNSIYLHWSNGNDNESGSSGISYQLYVGTSSQNQDIVNSNSNLANGSRKVAESGILKGNKTTVTGMSGGTYFFGVQSVDAAYKGSLFSLEHQALVIGINGPSAVCVEMNTSYLAKPSGNYTWVVEGGTIVSGQGSDRLEVEWNITGQGKIKISNGIGSRNTLLVDIDEKPQPTISGDNTVCTGMEEYTIADSKTRYVEWTTSEIHNIENQGMPSTVVSWNQAGEYNLAANAFPEHKGCATNTTLIISVDKRPELTMYGDNFVCAGDLAEYSCETTNVHWEVFNGTITKTLATGIEVTWPNTGTAEVKVEEKSLREFCTGYDEMSFEIYSRPAKPTLTLLQDTIIVSSLSPTGFYTWFYKGDLVVSGYYQGLITHIPGVFEVEVFNESGCGTKSDPFYYLVTSTESLQHQAFSIYPNPADQSVKLLLDDVDAGKVVLEMISATNSIVMELTLENTAKLQGREIDVSHLTPGIYIIRLTTKNTTHHAKFLKK
jgi:hypothetical protein